MITNSIDRDQISMSQFILLFWGCLLAPVVESLLSIAPLLGGAGSFLSPLLALPLLLLWACFGKELSTYYGGFTQAIQHILGNTLGKCVLLAYGLWGTFLLSGQLRLCATGFLAVGFQEGSLLFLLPVVAVFVWWMSGINLGSFARASTLYFAILLIVYVLVLGFSLSELSQIPPLWWEDLPEIGAGTLPVMGVLGYGVYTLFFYPQVAEPRGKPWISSAILGCFAISALLFVATGVFGIDLLVELKEPFFQLAKGIAISGGFQRVEALVLALWTLADFLLLGVLLRGAGNALGAGGKKSQHILGKVVVIACVLAFFLPNLGLWWEKSVLLGNLFFAWIMPCFLYLLHGLKKRKTPKS